MNARSLAAVPVGERSAVPTLDELRAGPPTLDIPTASAVLGISRSHGFALVKREAFPCRVIRVGTRWRVPTAALVAVLEADEPLRANA